MDDVGMVGYRHYLVAEQDQLARGVFSRTKLLEPIEELGAALRRIDATNVEHERTVKTVCFAKSIRIHVLRTLDTHTDHWAGQPQLRKPSAQELALHFAVEDQFLR